MSSLTIWEWLQSANSSLPRGQKRACDRLVRHHEAWGLENAAYNGLKVESTLMGNWKLPRLKRRHRLRLVQKRTAASVKKF